MPTYPSSGKIGGGIIKLYQSRCFYIQHIPIMFRLHHLYRNENRSYSCILQRRSDTEKSDQIQRCALNKDISPATRGREATARIHFVTEEDRALPARTIEQSAARPLESKHQPQ